MAKYNVIIHKEPGALFMVIHKTATGGEVWRGRCAPEEKTKTIAEAMSQLSGGKSLRRIIRERYDLDTPRPMDENDHQAEHRNYVKFAELWQSPTLSELIAETIAENEMDYNIVDLSGTV